MKRILFVCLGNICRSPMAEFILKDMVNKRHLQSYVIESAATSDEELGNDMYYAAKEKLLEMDVPFTSRHARQIRRNDYEKYDHIIAMDQNNLSSLRRAFGGDPDKKVRLLLSFCNENRSISDPWYTRNFDATYDDIVRGCEALLNLLENN